MAYKIKHKQTGQFYCPSRRIKNKETGKFEKSNWSAQYGKIYNTYGLATSAIRSAIAFRTIKNTNEIELIEI